jgi:hypothetical protein
MKLSILNPKQSLNKAYLKEKVSRENIELFKKNLSTLLGKINEKESEEHLKNLISEFLKDTWYKETNEINTKDRQDLVVHTGKTTKEPVGVILEVKKPSNKAEMMSEAKPNTKAMHELILYYLRERIDHNNIDIKYLVVTNIYEWFIIDEIWFERNVFRNVKLKKDFENWRLSGNDTRFFYENIAKPFLETMTDKIECTYFDIRPFTEVISNKDKKDDNKLISLYKILSPVHLLKKPFANDSNSLDTKFYTELLHIIGLEEVKDGGKRLIKRKQKPDTASILENTIMKLEDKDCLRNVSNLSSFGTDKQEQLFNVALELGITWINRVLFLKLLEGQLYKYHKGNNAYVFLNNKTIHDFDELSNLFFQVLAEKQATRRTHLKEKYKRVPYLNSSLFERTELERQTFDISGLDNNLDLSLISSSVLKNEQGKRKTGGLPTLHYLFDFLDAYDFTSEGSEEIQEQNKNLINASVLGLIFEKINGYKDGSFFTPGFVTMYMCRETIRKSVVQKFNEKYTIDCDTFDDLKNFVASRFKAKNILEFNKVINDLKICDPAVGSGHFLVSALNEVIAIKAELGILADKEGVRLLGYEVNIVNDELIITYNDNTEIFEYSVTGNSIAKDAQRVQKTLFHEKQSIIENSLFGVDINPNSVKICRLRLWIELLKSAYYTEESEFTELETLPNIDINIKCGNSLVSRFSLDADLKKALKGKWNIETYKIAVHAYHNAQNKEEKRKLEELIDTIKKDFRSEIGTNDPGRRKLTKLKEELYLLTVSPKLELDIELKKGGKKIEKDRITRLGVEIGKLEQELKSIEENKIYQNAFEWRFEFPEVLDNDGVFVGFDVVIGNPPYLSSKEFDKGLISYLSSHYVTSQYQLDLYVAFMERAIQVLKKEAYVSFITPNSWLKNIQFTNCRKFLLESVAFEVVFANLANVFSEASVDTLIYIGRKSNTPSEVQVCAFNNDVPFVKHRVKQERFLTNNRYVLDVESDNKFIPIIDKIRLKSIKLEEVADITRGVNPYDKYQGQSEEVIKNKQYHSTFKKDKTFVPEIRGKHVGHYSYKWDGKHYISYGSWLAAPREKKYFEGARLIMRQVLGDKLNCTIINENLIIDQSVFIAKPKKQYAEYLSAIQGVLGSRLIANYFKYTSNEFDALFPKIKIGEFRELPVPSDLKLAQALLGKKVESLLNLKAEDASLDTSKMENEIEQIVYKLFELSKEEISLSESM